MTLTAVLAGCGNEKRDFRVERLNPLITRADEERSTLAALLKASRPGSSQDARVLRLQVRRVAFAMRQIASLKPPGGVEGRFRRYARANEALLAALRRFVDAFAAGSEAGQQTEAERIRSTLGAAEQAKTDLQHALK